MKAKPPAAGSGLIPLECPCCQRKLVFDPVRGILRTHAPGMSAGKDMSLDAAVSALRREKDKADERFREALEKEGKRKESLEKKFEQSLREAGDSSERPLRPIDLD